MAVRSPQNLFAKGKDPLAAAFDYEAAAEMAYSLGQAGKRAEAALAALSAAGNDAAEQSRLLNAAAKAVHAYFIQRELIGLRRHESIIREMKIPGKVLARLGAI